MNEKKFEVGTIFLYPYNEHTAIVVELIEPPMGYKKLSCFDMTDSVYYIENDWDYLYERCEILNADEKV